MAEKVELHLLMPIIVWQQIASQNTVITSIELLPVVIALWNNMIDSQSNQWEQCTLG